MADDRRYGLIGNTGIKVPVRVATTAALTLNGLQTVDGVVLVANDRVLVKNQASGVENGIYLADTGAWMRAADCDGSYDLVKGSLIKVNEGTAAQGFWYCTTTDPIVVGTTSIAFAQASTILAVVSVFVQSLLDDADAAAARATLLINSPIACTMSGTGDAIILTSNTVATPLIDGLELSFIPTLSTTSAGLPTVNYNATGAKSLYAPDNMFYAFGQAVVAGMPTKIRYMLADDRFVVISSPLSARQSMALRPGVMQLSPITATTFNISGDGTEGIMMWDATKLAFNVALIGPGGLAAGAANLASITINGVAAQAAASNTLYYVYLSGANQPAAELSTTGPALQYNGLLTLTGDISKTYVGLMYTLDTGGGIDIRFDGNGGGSHGRLVNVTHSEFNERPLLLQTNQITTAGVASAAFVEIATTLRAEVVMDARLGCFYRVYGYAILDTVGATVSLEAYQGQAAPNVNSICRGTARGIGDAIPLYSAYGRALSTGHYDFQARGAISAGTAEFHLTAELWACI